MPDQPPALIGLTLTRYTAPWCGPCKAYAPRFDEAAAELKKKYPTLVIRVINVDDHEDECRRFGVRAIPHTILASDGGTQLEIGGLVHAVDVVKKFEPELQHLTEAPPRLVDPAAESL